MKISISGYGRMGKIIEKQAVARGHTVAVLSLTPGIDQSAIKDSDVIIDFSGPSIAPHVIDLALKCGTSIVSGTTGFEVLREQFDRKALKGGCAVCWASNFSLGMHIVFHMNRYLAELMSRYTTWQPRITETHHVHKLDAPSGTAITLAEELVAANSHLNSWHYSDTLTETDAQESVRVRSVRKGEVKGIHEVRYRGIDDDIILSHEAHSRDGFAKGAILAAERLQGLVGYHSFQELLEL